MTVDQVLAVASGGCFLLALAMLLRQKAVLEQKVRRLEGHLSGRPVRRRPFRHVTVLPRQRIGG